MDSSVAAMSSRWCSGYLWLFVDTIGAVTAAAIGAGCVSKAGYQNGVNIVWWRLCVSLVFANTHSSTLYDITPIDRLYLAIVELGLRPLLLHCAATVALCAQAILHPVLSSQALIDVRFLVLLKTILLHLPFDRYVQNFKLMALPDMWGIM